MQIINTGSSVDRFLTFQELDHVDNSLSHSHGDTQVAGRTTVRNYDLTLRFIEKGRSAGPPRIAAEFTCFTRKGKSEILHPSAVSVRSRSQL